MINMFPNQDIKPLLPAINSQRSSVYYRPQQPNYGVYPTNYQVAYLPPIAYEAQPILPPLQFYSTTGTSPSPHPDGRENSNYKLNYNHSLSYQTSPATVPAETLQQATSPQFTSVSPPSASDNSYKDLPINYSSIINHTISPSLKRKRRNKAIIESSPIQSQLPCPKCGKVFQKPYNLKSHMKSHSDEKPFKCAICSKTFARSHDKKRHEQLHNGEKNFKCEGYLKDGKTKWGCGKQFARSDALSRHFRTETGWLCIRPLMDEAKTLEANGVINDILSSRQ